MRQSGNLCEYEASADEMCRDKFVFGLKDNTICTELLKTHLKILNHAQAIVAGVILWGAAEDVEGEPTITPTLGQDITHKHPRVYMQ